MIPVVLATLRAVLKPTPGVMGLGECNGIETNVRAKMM